MMPIETEREKKRWLIASRVISRRRPIDNPVKSGVIKNRKPLHTPLGAGTDEGIRALYFRLVLPIQVRVCQGFLLMGYVMALIPLSCVGAHVYVLVASYCAISFSCSSARAISAFSLSTRRFISSMRELPFFEETERKQILFS